MTAQNNGKIPKSSQDITGKLLSRWRNHLVLQKIRPPFLDVACGDNLIATTMPGGFGIDIENYGQADIIADNFENIPLKSESLNTVTIVGSLNYFDKPEAAMIECHRILKPNGILIITMLNPSIGRIWHAMREPWAKFPGFTFQQIINFSNISGLQLVERKRFMLSLNNLYILKK